jgi:hypothetical protein
MSTLKSNTLTSKNLINTAAIEQQLYKRQLIAEDLKVSTLHMFIKYDSIII